MWLFLAQLAIKWLFNIPPHPISASALPGDNRTNEIGVEMNRNMPKSIPNIIGCDLKKNWQISIIFDANIFDTTCHQMTILVPISPNICFCTTWENPNRQNRTKMQYFIGFCFPQVRQKQTVGAVKNWTIIWSPVVSEILAVSYTHLTLPTILRV